MSVIGTYKKQGENFSGDIRTLALHVVGVNIRKVEKTSDLAPDYRITTNGAEIGAAWEKVGKESGVVYLSVKIDDPSIAAPINANLVLKDGDNYDLIWSR